MLKSLLVLVTCICWLGRTRFCSRTMAAVGTFFASSCSNDASDEVHAAADADVTEALAEVRGQIAAEVDVSVHMARTVAHGGSMRRCVGKATAVAQVRRAAVGASNRVYPSTVIGTVDNEFVLRGGSLKEPMLINGDEEKTGTFDTEFVLRGGHLQSPVLLTGLTCIDGVRFFRLQKTNPEFCQNP